MISISAFVVGVHATAALGLHAPIRKSPLNVYTLVMKLRAGSDMFDYTSPYWTDYNTQDNGTHGVGPTVADDRDDADTKLAAFLDAPLDRFKLCWGTLSACYVYKLGMIYNSAKEVFSGDYMASPNLGGGNVSAADSRRAFTDLFLPPGDQNYNIFWEGGSAVGCDMHSPGINAKCDAFNWARIGYCVNEPTQPCQSGPGHDADTAVGIGIRHQDTGRSGDGWSNGPFGHYMLSYGNIDVSRYSRQAWLFVANGDVSPAMLPSPTANMPTAFGDPHVGNLRGERFDILRPDNYDFLVIPHGAAPEHALLHVQARVTALGALCDGLLYITELAFRGVWLGETGSLQFVTAVDGDIDAEKAMKIIVGSAAASINTSEFQSVIPATLATLTQLHPEPPQSRHQHVDTLLVKLHLGPSTANVRVVHQKERVGSSNSLWLATTGLRSVEAEMGKIGGILGVDDHQLASRAPQQCASATGNFIRLPQPPGKFLASASLDENET